MRLPHCDARIRGGRRLPASPVKCSASRADPFRGRRRIFRSGLQRSNACRHTKSKGLYRQEPPDLADPAPRERRGGGQYVFHRDSWVGDHHGRWGSRSRCRIAASSRLRARDSAQHWRHVHAWKGAPAESKRGRHGQRHRPKHRRTTEHTSFNTDLAKMAEGAGCIKLRHRPGGGRVRPAFSADARRRPDGYLVAKIERFVKHKREWKNRKAADGIED